MAIPAASQFDYRVVLKRDSSDGWRGRAESTANTGFHPGFAGDRPEIELAGGVISLWRTESWVGRQLNPHYRSWGEPASKVMVRVGRAIEAFVEDGDRLSVTRGGTTDLSVALFRGDALLIGLGAIAGKHPGTGLIIEEDPRAYEDRLYGVAAELERSDTNFVWLNTSDPQCESVLKGIPGSSASRLIVAIAGPDADERRRLNHRVADSGFRSSRASCTYFDVDARFTTREQWLEYLRSLPETRPSDLWIRISADGVGSVVHEGEYVFSSPWHLYVQSVCRWGCPGEWSQLAIVREHPAITKQDVIESTELLASRRISFER